MKRLFYILIAAPLLAAFTPYTSPTDKGNAAYSAGKYDDALDAYGKAAEDNPDKAGAHYNLGCAYFKKGEYDHALKEYDAAVRLDPKMADAYYNAGNALYRLGKYEEALKAFRQADKVKGKDPDTEHNITVTLRKVKQEREKQKNGQPKGKPGQGQGGKGAKDQGRSSGGQNTGGQGPSSGQNQQGPPQMSNEEVQAMLDRQRKEEKSLRNYFRPGKKQGADRETQIEQILRGAGLAAPSARPARPGAPYVEKDW